MQNDTNEFRVGFFDFVKFTNFLPTVFADTEEKALLLNCQILDPIEKQLLPCLQCRDYFEQQKYFKANPECRDKLVLVKRWVLLILYLMLKFSAYYYFI